MQKPLLTLLKSPCGVLRACAKIAARRIRAECTCSAVTDGDDVARASAGWVAWATTDRISSPELSKVVAVRSTHVGPGKWPRTPGPEAAAWDACAGANWVLGLVDTDGQTIGKATNSKTAGRQGDDPPWLLLATENPRAQGV